MPLVEVVVPHRNAMPAPATGSQVVIKRESDPSVSSWVCADQSAELVAVLIAPVVALIWNASRSPVQSW
jgi:hypothetical protein